MDYELRSKIWARDKGVCQNCRKRLYEIVDPYEEAAKKLSDIKEIPIHKWSKKCWKCQEETPIVSYFLTVDSSYNIGDIEKLDKVLMQRYPFVKKIFSKTMGKEVIANTCIHCGSLQGNWFVMEDLFDIVYSVNLSDFFELPLPNNLTPEDLTGGRREDWRPYKRKLSIGHIHHRDGNKKNNDPDNLILLCRDCHARCRIKKK